MRTVAVVAIAFTVAALCGCGSLPWSRGFSSKSGTKTPDNVATSEANPFHRAVADPSQQTATRARRREPQRGSDDVAGARDADTKQLEAEIADLPADRQRAVLKEWRQIDRSMRPNFLQVVHSQRLLRETRAASNKRGRLTVDEYEQQVARGDREGFPAERRREPGPFGDGSQAGVRPGARGPELDEREPLDRFRSNNERGTSSSRAPADSGPPFGDRVSHRPQAPDRGHVQLAGTERSVSTPAEPFSPEWHRALQRLVELSDAENASEKSPARRNELSYLRRQVYRRMLYLLSGKTTQAVQAIPHIDAADQEFWQKTMWGISAYLDDRSESDRRSRATQTITRFNEAIEHLRAEADLVVKNVVFCRKIDSFGSYGKLPKAEFRPGEQVLVYAEIENFKSELTAEGHHRTRLKSEIELFQKVGSEYRESKQKFDFPVTEDICRSYRRDYFHSYILTLPQSLGLGDYVLKLTVTDHVGNKIGSDTVQFTVK